MRVWTSEREIWLLTKENGYKYNLPYVIHVCFLLHNFCKLHQEPVHLNRIEGTKKYDREFQTNNESSGYQTSNNESTEKKFRKIFVCSLF